MTKKYCELITEGWEIDPKTNEAVRVPLYPRTPKTVNKISGEVGGDEDIMPDYAEELYFKPAVQGDNGDAFFCGDELGHVVRVGKLHKLASWDQCDCTDNVSCRKSLHSGGLAYVANYKHLNTQLLECFVDPAEIAAIITTHNSDGAIRSKEYFVNGAVGKRTKGIYHSSTYAQMKDAEWLEYKAKAVEAANKAVEKLQEKMDNLGK